MADEDIGQGRMEEGKCMSCVRCIYLSTGAISSKTGSFGLNYFHFQKISVRDVIRVRHSRLSA